MTVTRAAALLALLGGVVWIVAAVLGWGDDVDRSMYLAGLVLFLLAAAAGGYTLVTTAPIWLRAVVVVASVMLGYLVWVTIRDAFAQDAVPVLGAGIVLVLAGGVGLTRRR
jgi:hypothetical protein